MIVSSGLPNPWVYLTELFWLVYLVASVEELQTEFVLELIW